ncbi:hypothetical protein DFR26_0488 [Paraperlucidibaca baekdonensis]|uniref:Lipoprotein n=1 Tax=Paraperlucidibaca baekdonensis TaxID=748120 RepID=A0A3E0H9A7_9GAMM|nr:hypothetical protein [Paraperlucidibaca baekdonensis]REH40288.1 hypothetical protein DFR26_0488 [Paraperlucidibaca baekdonensis]
MRVLVTLLLSCWLGACSTLGVLSPLQDGRAAMLAGDPQGSEAAFAQAMVSISSDDDRALISASDSARTGAALVTNDTLRRYAVAPYERLFMHSYQALNYLALQKPEAAAVELRRADAWQRTQALAYAEKIAEAEGIAPSDTQALSALDDAAARVRSSTQHAGALYLSGLFYEAQDALNDAFIDYRAAWQAQPRNAQLASDTARLAQRLRFDDPTPRATPVAKPLSLSQDARAGDIVVYWERGEIPDKVAFQLPLINSTAYTLVSIPYYPRQGAPAQRLSLQLDGQSPAAELLVDTHALAARTLKEQLPGILLRASVRAVAKQQLQRELNEQSPGLGLLGTVYSLLSERPDLRQWSNLPAQVYVLRQRVAAGEHRLSINGEQPLSVPVRAGKITLVHVVSAPRVSYSRIYPL